MKVYAISDLHLGVPGNRQALAELPFYPEDWLIVAGDVGETTTHLHYALSILTARFARVIWTPGNHDLWTIPSSGEKALAGEEKYQDLVAICRSYNVATPEDPYPVWPANNGSTVLAPLFLLYDYSFRPAHVPMEQAVAWAEESGVVCNDEFILHPTPYSSRSEWCRVRTAYTEKRLASLPPTSSIVLINHFPLRQEFARVKNIPRFSLWCGTTRTENWHTRFPVSVVVYGHVHVRATDYRDGVRFEEVSLGYKQNWRQEKGVRAYLREILPGPQAPGNETETQWYR
ncbi:metallophosphoesterase family protein [Dictyobacter aurantiacus]|uniref:Metallophosphoesterase n=1 Tax=Dictyobacter aurantiacus TaxID=1936993 RepID=A0A401ZQ39_9CHLR|nr:metallophosphoesterase [Dictyobacter aurantiacus]GCE08930.1 metallophosphoesterase [Dictyobacter aurantiacus]